jgi:hydroxymethylglutaryl-CoA reductase (NADPH)
MKYDIAAKSHPRPKWIILQVLNFVILGVFGASCTYLFLNYKNGADKSSAFPLMILMTLSVAYLFGFFGISFIDKDELSKSPSSFGLDDVRQQAEAAEEQRHMKSTEKTQYVARHDTAICSDPVSRTLPKIESAAPVGPEVDFTQLNDDEVLQTLLNGSLKDHQLEKKLGDCERAVCIRRNLYEHLLGKDLSAIPYTGYDWDKVLGANCEICIGYVPIPVGVVGPIVMNGEPIYIPMATTEGCLVASTNRGCKAISTAGGCCAVVLKDAITRAPCVRMPSAMRAAAVKKWCDVRENYATIEAAFNSTTNFGKLASLDCTIAGRNVYLRFACMSGDAMGMNMVSKGCLKAIDVLEEQFPDMTLVAISGNMCTDKKPSAINWILGRGKSIVVEAIIPDRIVTSVLKSSVHDMIETNKQKNHIGSAMAGSIGGFNAHAANIVTAVFLATGQDPAQNVESSNCLTIMEYADDGKSLHVSVTMPTMEVGTVGGGTHLPAQAGCLDICGVRGAAKGPDAQPGDNSRKLAQIVGAAVLAGELSLMAALAANHLVRSHMQHNRKQPTESAVEMATEDATAPSVTHSTSMPALSLMK